MKHTLTTLILTLLVAFACAGQTHAQRFLSYEPEVVELDGQLVVQSKYGPPNFGEQPKTDQKVRVPVLLLSQQVVVTDNHEDGKHSETINNVRQIQLAFDASETSHKKLIGKQVVVTGLLFQAHTGHHYTEAVMNVQSIERKPPDYDQRQFAVCNILTSHFNPSKRIATSKHLERQFRAFFAGERTEKSIKLEGTDRTINAAFSYDDLNGSQEGKPHRLRIAIVLSDEEENALDALGGSEAMTIYRRDWRLSVSHEVLVGETWHRLTLSCGDGNSQKR